MVVAVRNTVVHPMPGTRAAHLDIERHVLVSHPGAGAEVFDIERQHGEIQRASLAAGECPRADWGPKAATQCPSRSPGVQIWARDRDIFW